MLEELSDEQLKDIPNEKEEGDGSAVFMSQGTEADYRDFENEQTGMKKWLNRLKEL